jgi:hypothetical protein
LSSFPKDVPVYRVAAASAQNFSIPTAVNVPPTMAIYENFLAKQFLN